MYSQHFGPFHESLEMGMYSQQLSPFHENLEMGMCLEHLGLFQEYLETVVTHNRFKYCDTQPFQGAPGKDLSVQSCQGVSGNGCVGVPGDGYRS